jgi:hypothetical protein
LFDGEDEGEVAEAAVQLPRGGVGGVAAPHIVPEPHASLPSPPLRRALSAPLSLCPAPRFGSARRGDGALVGAEKKGSAVSRGGREILHGLGSIRGRWTTLYLCLPGARVGSVQHDGCVQVGVRDAVSRRGKELRRATQRSCPPARVGPCAAIDSTAVGCYTRRQPSSQVRRAV